MLRILIRTLKGIKIIATKLEAYEWCTVKVVKFLGGCKYVNLKFHFMSGCPQEKYLKL